MSELDHYSYDYAEDLIAQAPVTPRDSARLLVYNRATDRVEFDTFRNLTTYLPPQSVIVLNKTKVIPARLWATKSTGGKVQIFYLSHDRVHIRALSPAPLASGAVLTIAPRLTLTVIVKEGSQYVLKPSFAMPQLMAVLNRYGTTPIPPYIKHTPLDERKLRSEYQSVFAKTAGSVAAPTASLHFTPRLLAQLKKAGHDIRYVTLHVGLGTFAPLTVEQLKAGQLHAEYYSIDEVTAGALEKAKKSGRPIVAVGTTVVRTLESWATTGKRIGETTIFIREGYAWKFVDALITNFHVPRSSLLMLVAAFAGREKLLDLYRRAIALGFRLFSFGDGMLIK